MLLTERKTLPTTGEWLWEVKFDGYRILASTGQPRLKTKNGADATTWFPEIASALAALPGGAILDGEVCVLDDIGRSDFERLHERARRRGWYAGADPVAYCVFDLLVAGGRDLRGQPVEKRKAALRKLLADPPPGLLYVQDVDDAAWLYDAALQLGLEGIVGKRAGSPYRDGIRSPDWIKIKRKGAILPGFRRSQQIEKFLRVSL
ncbi:hypothetical protein KAF44_32115 [Cupriavidus necator]|nr:hypothetical protein KAF44_32115 [Cupriavidus necator]